MGFLWNAGRDVRMTGETDLSDPKSLIRKTVTCVGHKQTQEDFLSGKYGSIFWWGGYIFVCVLSLSVLWMWWE